MSDALETLKKRRLYTFQKRANQQLTKSNNRSVFRGRFLGFNNTSAGGNPCALVRLPTEGIIKCEAITSGQIAQGSTVSVCIPDGQSNGFMLGMPRGR